MSAPSRIDQRRIRDVTVALEKPEPTTLSELSELQDAIAACQSLDDLGPFMNEWAMKANAELLNRHSAAAAKLKTGG